MLEGDRGLAAIAALIGSGPADWQIRVYICICIYILCVPSFLYIIYIYCFVPSCGMLEGDRGLAAIAALIGSGIYVYI